MENVYETKSENKSQIIKWALFVFGFIILGSAVLIIGLTLASGNKSLSRVNTDQTAIGWLIHKLT